MKYNGIYEEMIVRDGTLFHAVFDSPIQRWMIGAPGKRLSGNLQNPFRCNTIWEILQKRSDELMKNPVIMIVVLTACSEDRRTDTSYLRRSICCCNILPDRTSHWSANRSCMMLGCWDYQ